MQLSTVQAEFVLLAVRQFVDDPIFMQQLPVEDRMAFQQAEERLDEALEERFLQRGPVPEFNLTWGGER